MQGYCKERFDVSAENELDDYTCAICLAVFKDPICTTCCRQTYCTYCITQWLSAHTRCPNDRRKLLKENLIAPPRALVNLLARLRIKCDSIGCQQIVELSQLQTHLEICEFNPLRKCMTCGETMGNQHNCIVNLRTRMDGICAEMTVLKSENKALKKYNRGLLKANRELRKPSFGASDDSDNSEASVYSSTSSD